MTGFIGVGQLRYILTNLGEKMTDDEVDELLKAVDTSPSGEVNYTGTYHLSSSIAASGWLKRSIANLDLNRSRPHNPGKLSAS